MYSETLEKLMTYTNSHGERKHGSAWKDIEMKDMLAFHGCMLQMSGMKLTKMEHYWSGSAKKEMDNFKMSRDHFLMIYRALRLYDVERARQSGASEPRQRENYDPLYKCRPVWNSTILNFQKARNPGRIFSLDESMAKFTVRFWCCLIDGQRGTLSFSGKMSMGTSHSAKAGPQRNVCAVNVYNKETAKLHATCMVSKVVKQWDKPLHKRA